MDGHLRGLRSLPLRAPRLTLVLIVTLTMPLAWCARSLRIEGAVADLLPAHDEARAYYDGVRTVFGSDEATLVGVFAPDVFTPELLAAIDRVSTRLAAIDGVHEVINLTTAKGIDSDELGPADSPENRRLALLRRLVGSLNREALFWLPL